MRISTCFLSKIFFLIILFFPFGSQSSFSQQNSTIPGNWCSIYLIPEYYRGPALTNLDANEFIAAVGRLSNDDIYLISAGGFTIDLNKEIITAKAVRSITKVPVTKMVILAEPIDMSIGLNTPWPTVIVYENYFGLGKRGKP